MEPGSRDVPLLGMSLAAAKRSAAWARSQRYFHNAGSWSAPANKFLKENGQRGTPDHAT